MSILGITVSQALGETPSRLKNTYAVRKKSDAQYFPLHSQLFCVVDV